ncbi:ATP-binding protein [Embleya sp. NPDC008237]|uniref:ATP-binding protein n=1 Tax=Embleya sp. NPDC008237 TaxID=3363978 RepID=UPI0036E13833
MAEPIESTVTLPTTPVMAGVARVHVALILADTPRLDDALVIASELATSAIRFGGADDFTITVAVHGQRARITVSDTGRRRWIDRGSVDPFGYGIGLVALLADEFGHDRIDGTSAAWAEITWRTS